MRKSSEQIEALIAESDDIEERIAFWQSAGSKIASRELRDGARAYVAWYAKARRHIPDSQRETFEDMYEGGPFVPRIRAFLSDPVAVSPLWDPDSPNPMVSEFQHPFVSTFKVNLDRQRNILIDLLEGEDRIVGVLDDLMQMFERIPRYLGVLERGARGNVPAPSIRNEFDLQLVTEALLRLCYDDVRPEDYVPERGGGKSRVDFLLRDTGVIVETKMTRDRLRDREVGEELIVDWKRYERHPGCQAILAVIYDPGRYLKNAPGLVNDLTDRHASPAKQVIIVH